MGDMLGTSVSGLLAFQRSLDTTSHNISNVNTEGYSRQRTELATRPATEQGNGFIGNGVETTTVRRLFDQNREDALRNAGTDFEASNTKAQFSERIDNLLADKEAGLSPQLQSFFDSLQDVANEPSAGSAREVALAEADSLVSRFKLVDQRLGDLAGEVNNQLQAEVTEINQLASSVADLNKEIQEAEGRTGQPANDLRDQRDLQIRNIAEKVGTQVIEQDNGAKNVFIGNGQPLVSGDRAGELGVRGDTFDPQQSVVTFTGASGDAQPVNDTPSGGRVGGLLDFRSEVLTPTRNDVGRLATELAGAVNQQNRLGLDANGDQGEALFATGAPQVFAARDNSGAVTGTPDVAIADNAAGALTGADYEVSFDGTEYTVENLDSGANQTIAENGSSTFEGLEIDTSAVNNVQAGDRFQIQPTRDAVAGMEVVARSGSDIAAAGPIRAGEVTGPNGGPVNSGTGAIENVTVSADDNVPFSEDVKLEYREADGGFAVLDDAGNAVGDGAGSDFILSFDPATDSGGATFTNGTDNDGNDLDTADFSGTNFDDGDPSTNDNPLEGVEFTMAGEPDDGDAFLMEENTNAAGDNRNAQELAGIADEGLLNEGEDSPQEFFSGLVGEVGTETRRAQSERDAQEQLRDQAREDRESLSGVNLEEEAANLLRFQQGFQAAARATSVANEVFQSLLGAVQR